MVRSRLAVRILLLDPASRVLLFEGRDLADDSDTVRFWFTAGGGVDDGETLADAGERELREETGLTGLDLVGPIHRREAEFLDHGQPLHQTEHFFAARAPTTELRTDGWTDLERRAVTRWRWWSADEVEHSTEVVHPAGLADLVRRAASLV